MIGMGLLLLGSLASCSRPLPTVPERQICVVIDPGHGGSDPGAVYNSRSEKDVALTYGQALAERVRHQLGAGEAILSRETDTFVSLRWRRELVDIYQARLFVSLHADASRDGEVVGTRIYYPYFEPQRSPITSMSDLLNELERYDHVAQSRQIAIAMADKLRTSVPRDVRVRAGRFFVLDEARTPTLLIELGYLSSPIDQEMLEDPQILGRFVEGMAGVIISACSDGQGNTDEDGKSAHTDRYGGHPWDRTP